jgi:hypothetical protein
MDEDKDSYEFAPPGPGLLKEQSLLSSNSHRLRARSGLFQTKTASQALNTVDAENDSGDDSGGSLLDDSQRKDSQVLQGIESHLDSDNDDQFARSGR